MAQVLRICKRGLLLLIIWGLALIAAIRAIDTYLDHRELSRRVAELEYTYTEQLEQYADVLAQSERVVNDKETQIQLLKERFGYTKPDESPIVVLDNGT